MCVCVCVCVCVFVCACVCVHLYLPYQISILTHISYGKHITELCLNIV